MKLLTKIDVDKTNRTDINITLKSGYECFVGGVKGTPLNFGLQ